MKHVLPYLPYTTSALEPHIDARTMRLHHGKHHAGYVKALNLALESAPALLQDKSAEWLLKNLNEIPTDIRTTVRNNAGGHVNHSLLWQIMAPDSVVSEPSDPLTDAINDAFGNFHTFQVEFDEAGKKLFGSGWVWLAKPQGNEGKLQILTTSGHDNPISQGFLPILVNDVWEHAYYLKHQHQRINYFRNWWNVVNWTEVSRRFEQPADPVEHHAEMIAKGNLETFG